MSVPEDLCRDMSVPEDLCRDMSVPEDQAVGTSPTFGFKMYTKGPFEGFSLNRTAHTNM
jgi:hypothetical protein